MLPSERDFSTLELLNHLNSNAYNDLKVKGNV